MISTVASSGTLGCLFWSQLYKEKQSQKTKKNKKEIKDGNSIQFECLNYHLHESYTDRSQCRQSPTGEIRHRAFTAEMRPG